MKGRQDSEVLSGEQRTEKTGWGDLYVRVAWAYYKEGLTQQQIAERFQLSRSKVHRMIKEAREKDIVSIEITHPEANLLGVEKELIDRFGLKDAIVIPSASEEGALKEMLGEAGAFYLRHKAPDFGSLGISIGTTLQRVAESFQPTEEQLERDVKVVSLHGNLTGNIAVTPYSIGNVFADKLDGDFYNVWAPAIAEDEETAEVFRSEPWIKEVLEMAAGAELLLLGIGTMDTSATLFQEFNYLSREEISGLKAKGAVGDTLGQFFDIQGKPVDTEIRDRIIGLPLEELKSKTATVGIAGGEHKYEGILAALRGGYLQVLITDETVAKKLVEE